MRLFYSIIDRALTKQAACSRETICTDTRERSHAVHTRRAVEARGTSGLGTFIDVYNRAELAITARETG